VHFSMQLLRLILNALWLHLAQQFLWCMSN
jgi:hypothetical protein